MHFQAMQAHKCTGLIQSPELHLDVARWQMGTDTRYPSLPPPPSTLRHGSEPAEAGGGTEEVFGHLAVVLPKRNTKEPEESRMLHTQPLTLGAGVCVQGDERVPARACTDPTLAQGLGA